MKHQLEKVLVLSQKCYIYSLYSCITHLKVCKLVKLDDEHLFV